MRQQLGLSKQDFMNEVFQLGYPLLMERMMSGS
jgi:hypothetical protein